MTAKTPVIRDVDQTKAASEKKAIDRLLNWLATTYLAAVVFALPLVMGATKYAAITKFKATFFSVLSSVALFGCAVILGFAFICTTVYDEQLRRRARIPLRRRITERPLFLADVCILAYWVLMLLSCLRAYSPRTAFFGLEPRDNGFLYQTLYVAAYFIISRLMKPTEGKALIFVLGGTVLAVLCILHYYGVDVYDVVHYSTQDESGVWQAHKLSATYAGPFWNDTKYRFLGPVGNVNLGSYILSVALVVAAGMFVADVKPLYYKLRDRWGISLAVCFCVILFAELNINTDAGLVALAAAALAMPIVLCGTLERLSRMLLIFTLSGGTVLLDHAIDSRLRGEDFGTTGMLLLLGTTVLALLTAVLYLVRLRAGERLRVSPRVLRSALAAFAALLVVGGVGLSLVITRPDEPAAGALSGATAVLEKRDLKEKSDTMIHELGQILRGNLDDSFGHNRLFTWKRTLSLVRLRPLLGIGPDNFPAVFARYYHKEAVAQFPSSNGGLDKAHNEFLDVLLDNGILGLLAYLGFFASLLYYALRDADKKRLAPALGVAVISYMAHAFFGYQLPIQSPVMWMLIGAAGAFARAEALPGTEEAKEIEGSATVG